MTKQQTIQIKGVAILMMLWLHLFSNYDTVEHCSNFLTFWNGDYMAFVLKKLCSMCVPIYIFLGGYGLAKTYLAATKMNNNIRVLTLYVNFWIIFLLSYPIGCLLNPALFMNSISEICANAIAFDCTFNGAWWFLFPYALITLASSKLIEFLKYGSRKRIICYFTVALILFVISYVRLEAIDSHDWLSLIEVNAWRTAEMLLMFGAGVMFALHNVIERVSLPKSSIVLWVLFVVLILLKLSIGASSLLHPPFVLAMILIWCRLQHSKITNNILAFIGKHSTNLWLIHYFFFAYIAHGELYALKYPIAIYLSLVAVSLFTSMLISMIFQPLRNHLRKSIHVA